MRTLRWPTPPRIAMLGLGAGALAAYCRGGITCDFFDTRQGFLRMCQGNNYQADTLRRAKHSSMMVLWHLHNPSIPAYAHACNACEADIPRQPGC